MMEKNIHIIPKKKVFRIIAILLVTIMMVQLFPPIVLGVQATNVLDAKVQTNELQENSQTNELTNELQNEVVQENQMQSNVTEKSNEQTLPEETNPLETEESIKQEEETKEKQEVKITEKTEEKIIGELEEKRTLNEKHFLLEDGSILATIYPSNVHYKKEDKLVEINNQLLETEDKEEKTNENQILENQENEFKIKFAKKSNKNKLASLTIGNQKIKWSLQNSNKVEGKVQNQEEKTNKTKLANITSGIMYENILTNVDLEYNLISNQVKENIILKDKTASNTNLTFDYDVGNLKMEQLENGQIVISEKTSEKVILVLDTPYMFDSQGNMSSDISIQLKEEKNKKYTLKLEPNKEWLEAEDRIYPVTIDPTVQTSINRSDIQDTYIFNGDTGYPDRGKAHILRIGSNNKMKNPTRSLVKFTLPSIAAGDQVIAAMLDICSYPDTNEWTPPTNERSFAVHKVTADWSSTTANWQNMNTNYDTKVTDYQKFQFDPNNQCKFTYFDITTIVKDWYITGNNYGVMLKEYIETYNAPYSDMYFFSADVNDAYANGRPMVQIVYRNQTGLEGYQTYHTQQIGRAGTAYTNDYNGNLVLIHEDAQTPGTRMPVSIRHVYNANDIGLDRGYGKGFRLNLYQQISKETIGGKEYANYIDEDGTRHYFEKVGSEYKEEDNQGLKLKLENNKFILEDKEKTICTFSEFSGANFPNTWFLNEIKDSNGNKITLTLQSDYYIGVKITKVTDGAGNYLTLNYGERLNSITDMAGRVIKYTYTNGQLTKIEYPDAKVTNYEYGANSLLTKAKNIDNSYLTYEYYSDKANRVKAIKEYSTAGAIGNTLSITYGNNTTTFTDNKGYKNTYSFNNVGQTISIGDFGKGRSRRCLWKNV